jgi:RNA polymerase sigma factor (sigma-70 family)
MTRVTGMTTDEAELTRRAKRGDALAYEELVRGYQRLAFQTAYLITQNVAEAEDAVQEAFVKAYRALNRLRSGAPFRPWLLRIVANEAKNRHKAAGRRTRLALQVARTYDPENSDSPEAVALGREMEDMVLEALNELRYEDRMVIAYRYFFELSEKETAAALGCAKGTVKSRLSRAIGRLRKQMEKHHA